MQRPLKLTYIIDALTTNLAGTENQLCKMIQGLSAKGFEIDLICFHHNDWIALNPLGLPCRIKIIEFKKLRKLRTYINFFRLVFYLKSTSPDVVHTFFPSANIFGIIAARLVGVSCIISSRRDYGEWMNSRYLLATRFANRFVDRIVSNSTNVKDLTVKAERVNASKVDVIFNGILPEEFEGLEPDLDLRKQLNIANGNKVVGLVANFRPMKHHETFLRAAKEVLKERKDVTFLLLGSGPREEKLRSLVTELGIADHIIFVGRKGEIKKYLSLMDVGVNCSEREGLSNAIMEYMSSGIPSIVTSSGGTSDLIEDKVSGYVFKLNDYKTLSRLILELLEDDLIRAKFAKNAKDTVMKKMRLPKIISEYESLYKSLVYDKL